MALNLINIILLFLLKKTFIFLYSNEYNNAVNNSNSILNKSLTLGKIFDIFIDDFSKVYKEKGLTGIKNYTNYINQTINNIKASYEWAMINSKWTDQKLSSEIKNIEIISKIFKNIKITGTIFTFIQAIISFITKAALIPFYVLAIYSFFKKLIFFFSFIFSSSLATIYFSNDIKFFNSILNNILAMKELSRVLWLKSYNYIYSENLPLYKIETILEEPEIIESKSSYFSWLDFSSLDLSFITSIDYSFSSHPYIYSAVVGISTIGLASAYYYNPSLIADSSSFIWDKSKAIGSFVLSYFIHSSNTDGSDGSNSSDSSIGVEDHRTSAQIEAYKKVDKIQEDYETEEQRSQPSSSEKILVNTGYYTYQDAADSAQSDRDTWSSSESSTPRASRSPIVTDEEYSQEVSQNQSSRSRRKPNNRAFTGHIDPLKDKSINN